MACHEREIEYCKENNRVRNNGIESWKNVAYLQTYSADI